MRKGTADAKWMDFARWCAKRGLAAFPAHPWTVAAFARWCENRRAMASIRLSLQAISRVHLLNAQRPPDRDPVVIRTLRGIALRQSGGWKSRSLFRADDFADPQPADSDDRASKPQRPRRRNLRTRPPLVHRRPR